MSTNELYRPITHSELIVNSLRRWPNREAFSQDGVSWTYRETEARLRELGEASASTDPQESIGIEGLENWQQQIDDDDGLADAFAGHGVGDGRRIADEHRAGADEGHPSDPSRDRPGLVGRLGLGVGAEEISDVWPREEVGPEVLHGADAVRSAPLDAETDVGAVAVR